VFNCKIRCGWNKTTGYKPGNAAVDPKTFTATVQKPKKADKKQQQQAAATADDDDEDVDDADEDDDDEMDS